MRVAVRATGGDAPTSWYLVPGFVCVALLYALLIPRWLPIDEIAHFYYVGHLVDSGRYPLPTPTGYDFEVRQHPPLAALVYAPFLKAALGLPLTRQVLCLRLVSVAIGAITVFVNLRLLALLFGDASERGLLMATAGAIVAFNPAFLAICSTVTNDNLLALLGAAVTLQAARLVGTPAPARRDSLLLYLLIGLACETKALALGLLPIPVLVWWLRRRRYPGDYAGPLLIVNVAIMLALAAPPYLVKLVAYRDPFGTAYMHTVKPYMPPSLRRIRAAPSQVLETFWLFASFLRGALTVQPTTTDYIPFALLSLAPCSLIWRWVRGAGRVRCTREQLVGLAVIALTVGAFVIKNVFYYDPDGRYLFMAIGPSAWLITSGIYAVARRIGDQRHILLRLVLIYIVLYSIVAALRYLPTAQDVFRTFSF